MRRPYPSPRRLPRVRAAACLRRRDRSARPARGRRRRSVGTGVDAGSEAPGAGAAAAWTRACSPRPGPTIDSSGGPWTRERPIPEASPSRRAAARGLLMSADDVHSRPSVCCATGTGQGNTPTFKCQSAHEACGSQAARARPSRARRPPTARGEVCCGENNNGFYAKVSCEPTCTGHATRRVEPRSSSAIPPATTAPPRTTCQPSQVLAGYNVCN